jgi:hypothetical protein
LTKIEVAELKKFIYAWKKEHLELSPQDIDNSYLSEIGNRPT